MIKALGRFDLDPCSPVNRPWPTARRHFTIEDDGLSKRWHGRVWLNPPYGGFGPTWVRRLIDHGDGVCLMFARTDAGWFQEAMRHCSAALFLKGRVNFHHVTGERSKQCPAPSVLFAFGGGAAKALKESGLKGFLVQKASVLE